MVYVKIPNSWSNLLAVYSWAEETIAISAPTLRYIKRNQDFDLNPKHLLVNNLAYLNSRKGSSLHFTHTHMYSTVYIHIVPIWTMKSDQCTDWRIINQAIFLFKMTLILRSCCQLFPIDVKDSLKSFQLFKHRQHVGRYVDFLCLSDFSCIKIKIGVTCDVNTYGLTI